MWDKFHHILYSENSMGNNNDVRLFLISNNQGFYVISQNLKSSNPIIYKYVFNTSQLTFKTISSYAGYGHGSFMLSDTQLFLLAVGSISSSDLYFNKLSYASTAADWTSRLSWPTSLWTLGLSETLLSSDKTKLYIFPAYGNPRYLYFMSIRLTDGGKVDTWYKSNLSVDKVFGSAQYGNYIVIAAEWSPNNCLMLVDLSKSTFNLKGFTGGNLKQVVVDPSTGR